MAFSDEEILEDFVAATTQQWHSTEFFESGFILKRLKVRARKQKKSVEEYAAARMAWYLRKRDTPKYKRNKVKSQMAYYARNAKTIKHERSRRSTEAQLLKYLQLYLTFNPDAAKRAHVVALLQLFQPNVD